MQKYLERSVALSALSAWATTNEFKTNCCKILPFDNKVYEIIGNFSVSHSNRVPSLISCPPFVHRSVFFIFILDFVFSGCSKYCLTRQMNDEDEVLGKLNALTYLVCWHSRHKIMRTLKWVSCMVGVAGVLAKVWCSCYVFFHQILNCADNDEKRGNENDNIFLIIHFKVECQR